MFCDALWSGVMVLLEADLPWGTVRLKFAPACHRGTLCCTISAKLGAPLTSSHALIL